MREDITNIELEILKATGELDSFEVGDEMYNSRLRAITGLLDIRKKMFDEEGRIKRSEKEDIHQYIGNAINIASRDLP